MRACRRPDFDAQMDRKAWPALKEKLVEVFKTKSRDEWCKIMEGTDICFAPVLTMQEAPKHPHMAARETFVTRHGVTQPAPAPRFSRTPSAIREAAKADIADVTSEWERMRRERDLNRVFAEPRSDGSSATPRCGHGSLAGSGRRRPQ